MHKLEVSPGKWSITNCSSYGPRFGNDDLYIAKQSNIFGNDSYANIGNRYKNDEHYPYGRSSSW
jgi:hypothetical protein